MTSSELLSMLINVGVGAWLAFYYPGFVQRRFAGGRIPPLFSGLATVLRPFGWLLMVGSVAFVAYRLSSAG